MRKPWFIFGAIMWLLVIVLGVQSWQRSETLAEPATGSIEVTPVAVVKNGVEKNSLDQATAWKEGLPDFSFTAHTGETITKADLLGTPWVAAFIFTSCAGTCPALSTKMEILQDELKNKGADVKLITFTVDPETDTPEVLAKYAKSFNADPERWLFLTGSEEEIFSLIQNGFKVYVGREDGKPQGFKVAHSNDFMLVDEKGFVVEKADAKTDAELASFRRKLVKRYGAKK